MKKTLIYGAIALVVDEASAAGAWDYKQHGADWEDACTKDALNQSPINLISPSSADFAYPLIEGVIDAKSYLNQKDRTVTFNGHTSQIDLAPPGVGEEFGFTSSIPMNFYGADVPISFEAKQFHFHSPSEHTFDGNYFDLEMHTVHLDKVENADHGFMAAALGIMFSVDNYNAKLSIPEQMIIDNFFDTLNWEAMTDPVVSSVAYADLINIVDFNNRWVYQGSVTTPPCGQKVMWNEISTVYPIKQAHVDLFKGQLARQYNGANVYDPQTLADVGNYREIQQIDEHKVMYVSNPPPLHTDDPMIGQPAVVPVPAPVVVQDPIPVEKSPPSSSFSTGDGFEAKMGDSGFGNRQKSVQFVSIAPLDRLLNQKDRDDSIRVSFSCQPKENWVGGYTGQGNDYDLKFNNNQINTVTCFDGSQPDAINQVCKTDPKQAIQCNSSEDYKVELFDLVGQKLQNLATPPSLGSFVVTREMMECLSDDYIKIHFEYGKRQELAGAEACYDHTPYIGASGKEDDIPFTILDICNKANTDRKRCFLYSYQVSLYVGDQSSPPLLEPKVYTKITFKSLNSKMIILPGDQIKTRFVSDYTDQEAIRLSPEIYSSSMPSPIRERYQMTDGVTRLPCDDRKVADTLQCDDFVVHCTEPNHRFSFTVQGAGDIYKIETTCAEFMKQGGMNWGEAQNQLTSDFSAFSTTYKDDAGNLITQSMSKVQFENKFGVMQQEEGWFQFDYSVWWRMHSNEPRCYAGVHMTSPTPTCQFQCAAKECFLKGPAPPNTGKRMLVAADGRPDTSEATPSQFEKRFLQKLAGSDVQAAQYVDGYPNPLIIPTRHLNPAQYIVPEKLLQKFLNNYNQSPRVMNLEPAVIEGEVTDGEAAPVMLSASFEENIGSTYNFNVEDKLKQDISPPSAIQIEKLPKNGKILTTNHDGTIRELQVGDIVSTEMMANFKYDQGEDICSSDNKAKCEDSFQYTTMSSWIGTGVESEAQINLTPVKVELTEQSAQELAAVSNIEVTPDVEQKFAEESEVKSAPLPVESAGCDAYPTMLVNFMVGLIAVIVSMLIASVTYIIYKNKQNENKKIGEFANKDFDSIVVEEVAARAGAEGGQQE